MPKGSTGNSSPTPASGSMGLNHDQSLAIDPQDTKGCKPHVE